jgi:hypothetical protein
MARIKDFAVTEYGLATIATLVCNMPQHAANDVLIYFASKDGNPTINSTAGWTAIQDGASAGMAYRCMFKLATSSAETLSVITGTAENWVVVVVCIEGADGSSLANLIANSGSGTAESSADDTTSPFDGPSTSTNTDTNCLIFHAWFSDSGIAPTAYAPLTNIYAGDNASNSVGVAYTFQAAAGSVVAASWFSHTNDDGRGIVLAVKDNSSGVLIPPFSDSAVSSGQVLRPGAGLSTQQSDTWPTSVTLPALGDDFDNAYAYIGGTPSDVKSALNSAATADVTFPAAGTTDAVYFGGTERFQAVIIDVSTAGTVGTLAWEYYDGSGWVTTGVTGSNLTATGWVLITLNPVAVAAMSQVAVNSVTCYWLRARVSATYTIGIVASQARKDGRTTIYVVASASADNGTNPYTNGMANAGSTTATRLAGFQWAYGAALDMDTGIIFGTYRFALHRDGVVDASKPMPIAACGGLQITFNDTNNYYKSYVVHASGSKSADVENRNVFAIDWNGSAIPWAERDVVNKSAVTYTNWTSLGAGGAVAVAWSMFSLVSRIGIAGGSSTYLLTFEDIKYVANRSIGMFPFVQIVGSTASIWVPLQFGGGSKLCISVNQKTFQFPKVYDGINYFNWNAAVNVAGLKFYPKSGDILTFTKCLFTSESAYRFEFDSSMASSGFTLDMAGSTVVNATVTLQAAVSLTSVTFTNCPVFTQNGATLTSCFFSGTKVASASPAGAALISLSSFISAGTGHAIEISGTAANISLSGLLFSGYAASDGSSGNEAIYVNIATGTMTITIIGGGSTPSIRTAGATVIVSNPKTLTLTGLIDGSDISILTAGTTTERVNVQENSGTTYEHNYTYSASDYVDIGVFKTGYIPFYIRTYLLGNADASLPIVQVVDRAYLL